MLVVDEVEKCPHCGNTRLVRDPLTLELVCPQCGTVVSYPVAVAIESSGCAMHMHRTGAEHRLVVTSVCSNTHLYSVAAELARVLGIDRRRVFAMLIKNYVYCVDMLGVAKGYKQICAVARTLAEIAVRNGRSPMTEIRRVLTMLRQRVPRAAKLLFFIQDIAREYVAKRRELVFAKVVEEARKRRLKIDLETLRKIFDKVYRPELREKTIVEKVLGLVARS